MTKIKNVLWVFCSLTFCSLLLTAENGTPEFSSALLLSLSITLALVLWSAQSKKMRRREYWINFRECQYFIESWPEDDDSDLGPRYYHLYQSYDDPRQLKPAELAFRDRLRDWGNLALADDTPDDLKIPTGVIYAQEGQYRRETKEQYFERCRKIMDESATAYHITLKNENSEDYESDVILRSRQHYA